MASLKRKIYYIDTCTKRGYKIALNNGCLTCHSIDGTRRVGPTWKNLYKRKVRLQNDSVVIADSSYIKESILQPKTKIVRGYYPAMPGFSNLSETQIECIIAYIKSISKQ